MILKDISKSFQAKLSFTLLLFIPVVYIYFKSILLVGVFVGLAVAAFGMSALFRAAEDPVASTNDDQIYVPPFLDRIDLSSSKRYVLVEDDFLVRMGWQSVAEEKGFHLEVYSNAEDVLANLPSLSVDSVIFSDSDLGGGMRGEDLLRLMFEKGYRDLYLETGFGGETFEGLAYIKGIVSKTPPF